MSECCDIPVHICQFPTELLIHVFKFLTAKNLIVCRQVCSRWRAVVDLMSGDDDMWEKYCEEDFLTLYLDAKKKSNSCELWFDTYQSLTLWGRLTDAKEVIEEFCHSSASADEIFDLVVLKNGIVSVRKRSGVFYYNISTLEITERDPVYGDFTKYIEFDDALIILGSLLHLRIIKRPKHELQNSVTSSYCEIQQDEEKNFYYIKYLLTVGRDIYFINCNNDIFHCNLDRGPTATPLPRNYESNVITLSIYNGSLYVLMQQRDVYIYKNNTFVKLFNLASRKHNIFDCLWEYQFLETIDWVLFYIWVATLPIKLPQGVLKYICMVRVYGDTFFICTKTGTLAIYHKPYINGRLDLCNHKPVKEYNFLSSDFHYMSPILSVDIVEIKGGHKILIAMPRKVIVITYNHGFDMIRSKSVLQLVKARPHF